VVRTPSSSNDIRSSSTGSRGESTRAASNQFCCRITWVSTQFGPSPNKSSVHASLCTFWLMSPVVAPSNIKPYFCAVSATVEPKKPWTGTRSPVDFTNVTLTSESATIGAPEKARRLSPRTSVRSAILDHGSTSTTNSS
jgi:hypothetical protein